MFTINDYVTKEDSTHPTGIITAINGNMTATVRWGIQDGRTYDEEIPQSKLTHVYHEIIQPDQLMKRQAEEAGGHYISDNPD